THFSRQARGRCANGEKFGHIKKWTHASGANEDKDATLSPLMPDHEETLPPDAATAADHRNPRRRNNGASSNGEAPDLGVLVTPQPHHDLERLVLHADVRDDIAAGLRAIQ